MRKKEIIFHAVFDQIFIPSVNLRAHGERRFYVHQEHLIDQLKLKHRRSDLTLKNAYPGLVGLRLAMITEKDIDNPIKTIQDALEKSNIITDDKNIVSLGNLIVSRETKKKGKDSIAIQVWKVTPAHLNDIAKESEELFNDPHPE